MAKLITMTAKRTETESPIVRALSSARRILIIKSIEMCLFKNKLNN